MITLESADSYEAARAALLEAITRRGLTIFGQIDHAESARAVDMQLGDEAVVIFGNPRAGTPLMQDDPRIGIELPLRILIWRAGDRTMLGYNDPRELADSYEVGVHIPTLEAMSSLLADLVREAVRQEPQPDP